MIPGDIMYYHEITYNNKLNHKPAIIIKVVDDNGPLRVKILIDGKITWVNKKCLWKTRYNPIPMSTIKFQA